MGTQTNASASSANRVAGQDRAHEAGWGLAARVLVFVGELHDVAAVGVRADAGEVDVGIGASRSLIAFSSCLRTCTIGQIRSVGSINADSAATV